MSKASATRAADAAARAADAAARAANAASDAEDAPAVDEKLGPLFTLKGERGERHDRTQVHRLEPIDEGHLGDIPADATVEDIRRRWGGGRFMVVAVDADGEYLKRNSRVNIAGDPIFENDVGQKRYERWLEQQFGKAKAEVVAAGPDLSAIEESRHQRTLERIKAEAEAAVIKARAEAETREAADERRRKREREDREEERKRERDEREAAEQRRWSAEVALRRQEREEREVLEERRRREELEERRAEREHRQDPTEMLMRGVQLAMSMGGGGGGGEYPDAATAFVAKLPEIFSGAKDLAAASGMGGARPNPAPKAQRAVSEKIEIEGALADRIKRTASALTRAGENPEKIISQAMAKALQEVTPKGKPPAALPPKPTAAKKPAKRK